MPRLWIRTSSPATWGFDTSTNLYIACILDLACVYHRRLPAVSGTVTAPLKWMPSFWRWGFFPWLHFHEGAQMCTQDLNPDVHPGSECFSLHLRHPSNSRPLSFINGRFQESQGAIFQSEINSDTPRGEGTRVLFSQLLRKAAIFSYITLCTWPPVTFNNFTLQQSYRAI